VLISSDKVLISSDKVLIIGDMIILKEIQKGESRKLEFKQSLPQGNSIIRTAVAFANSGGGKLIIGIEDKTKKIIGIDPNKIEDILEMLTQSLFDSISPKIDFEIFTYALKNKNIIVIEVFPGNSMPYFIQTKGKEQGTYIRVGATNRLADSDFRASLERQKLHISYDEEIARGFSEKDLDIKSLSIFFKKTTGRNLSSADLVNLKILKLSKNKKRPTVGGLLVCGKKQFGDSNTISCALFKGDTVTEFLDQKEMSGPLYQQVEGAMSFLKQHIPLAGKINNIQRTDTYQIPLLALREAVINAVVHRDYSLNGSNIKIAIFDSKIEITSPGVLPKSLTIEDLSQGRSEIRNKVISRFFKEIKFVEQWGTGITKIIQSCEERNLRKPEFIEGGLFFQVRIFRNQDILSDFPIQRTHENSLLSQQEDKIIKFLTENQQIQNFQVRELLGRSPSRVRQILDGLVEKKLIMAIGMGKGRVYRLIGSRNK
jgi:ATP-dependent DNA helicase RecG